MEVGDKVPPNEAWVNICLMDQSTATLSEAPAEECHVKVKVLYTGGTIGMVKNTGKVLAPKPNAFLKTVRGFSELHDEQYRRQCFQGDENTLVLPEVGTKKRVTYSITEYSPLLDSSNMAMGDYTKIAEDIKESYEDFDGFVILHGTDTLAYTASALSFMLEHLGKPVIVTGSQIPIFEARTDGRDNFLGALIIAGNYDIPEVTVFFGNKLYRGNRTIKISPADFKAFASPNVPPLVTVGRDIEVDYKAIFYPHSNKLQVHTVLNNNVGLLRLYPSIATATVEAFFQPPIQGVVLQSYGSGNIPSNRGDLLAVIRAANDRGLLIVNCTQCTRGGVTGPLYETSRNLYDLGVISGGDMTPEAALAKLAYVLSVEEWDMETKREKLQANLRGELSCETAGDSGKPCEIMQAVSQCLHISSSEEADHLKQFLYAAILNSAVLNGSLDKLTAYMDQGVDLKACHPAYAPPLHVACSEGQLEVVRHLLQRGASVHMMDRFGNTPLLCAIEFDRHHVIELLVECGAHVTGCPTVIGDKLCSAAARGNIIRLRSYQLARANLNQADVTGRTALEMASMHGRLDCVTMLTAALGADTQQGNSLQETHGDVA